MMSLIFPLAALAALATAAASDKSSKPVPVPEGYALLWHDEFNVDGRPDPEIWGYEQGFRRNEELQWYQEENAVVRDGLLVIEGRRVDLPNPLHAPASPDWRMARERIEYTSASLRTIGKREWLYGRLEVRARIRNHPGLWPAIWTLGSAREWPACGEVGVMELYGGKILANAAWANTRRWQAIWDSSATPVGELGDRGDAETWDDDFHVWRMDWDEDEIRLYLDDRLLNTIDLSQTINRTADGANPFREPHYLILNLAIGGTNGGDPSGTDFPSRYEIDWVRVYEPTPAAPAHPTREEDSTADAVHRAS